MLDPDWMPDRAADQRCEVTLRRVPMCPSSKGGRDFAQGVEADPGALWQQIFAPEAATWQPAGPSWRRSRHKRLSRVSPV